MNTQTQSVEAGQAGSTVQKDFVASIVVFLVALPLCMGIAIASGAPPAAGLITGIVGGLIVGWFAGSPLQVSGPAAGLAVIVYELIHEHGIAVLGVIVLLAGLIQLTAGILKLGQWFRAVSPAVIQGMLAGIGILIFASQFHVMVDDAPKGSGVQNLITIPGAIWKGIDPAGHDGANESSEDSPAMAQEGSPAASTDEAPAVVHGGSTTGPPREHTQAAHRQAAGIGLLTIIAIIVWQVGAPKKLRLIPAPLLAVVLGTAAATVFGLEINRVDVPSNLLQSIEVPTWADLQGALSGSIILAALGMALVASAETLLCATAVDQMHTGPRTRYDRELMAQGVGNTICGFVGGLPMTGVIVRSSANVAAGAKTRASAILHGAWLLIFVAALPWVLKMIPTATLAAILVFTGYKLVNVKAMKSLLSYGRSEFAIYVATVVGVVTIDLLTGVLIGVGLSLAKLLYTFSHLVVRLEIDPKTQRTTLYLNGAATIVRLPLLASKLEEVPPNTELHVHFEHLDYIDHACLDLLMQWERQHHATGGRLMIDWDNLTARFRQDRPLVEGSANAATLTAPTGTQKPSAEAAPTS